MFKGCDDLVAISAEPRSVFKIPSAHIWMPVKWGLESLIMFSAVRCALVCVQSICLQVLGCFGFKLGEVLPRWILCVNSPLFLWIWWTKFAPRNFEMRCFWSFWASASNNCADWTSAKNWQRLCSCICMWMRHIFWFHFDKKQNKITSIAVSTQVKLRWHYSPTPVQVPFIASKNSECEKKQHKDKAQKRTEILSVCSWRVKMLLHIVPSGVFSSLNCQIWRQGCKKGWKHWICKELTQDWRTENKIVGGGGFHKSEKNKERRLS